jgi:hypothetical protein
MPQRRFPPPLHEDVGTKSGRCGLGLWEWDFLDHQNAIKRMPALGICGRALRGTGGWAWSTTNNSFVRPLKWPGHVPKLLQPQRPLRSRGLGFSPSPRPHLTHIAANLAKLPEMLRRAERRTARRRPAHQPWPLGASYVLATDEEIESSQRAGSGRTATGCSKGISPRGSWRRVWISRGCSAFPRETRVLARRHLDVAGYSHSMPPRPNGVPALTNAHHARNLLFGDPPRSNECTPKDPRAGFGADASTLRVEARQHCPRADLQNLFWDLFWPKSDEFANTTICPQGP